jgi:hypothetical protein
MSKTTPRIKKEAYSIALDPNSLTVPSGPEYTVSAFEFSSNFEATFESEPIFGPEATL